MATAPTGFRLKARRPGGPISGVAAMLFGSAGALSSQGALAGSAAIVFGQSATLSGGGAPAFGPSLDFFAIPSLQDERDLYTALSWTRPNSPTDESFDFIDPGAITETDVHDDSEADDLWTWDTQVRRGYPDAIAATYRSRWLTYFKDGTYRADLIADDANRGDITPATSADPFCHGYGNGLITIGYLDNDATALTEAETIADVGLLNLFGSTSSPGSSGTVGGRTVTALSSSGHNMGVGGGRQMARIGQLIANLAYATGKKKWMDWLDAITDAYLGAATWWDTTDGLGIVAGGAYFCDRDWMAVNGQQGTSAYDSGARSNSIYQYGMHAEFLWRAWLITKRSDVKDRIIAFARFMEHYGHNPANTGSGGPFCSSYMGITAGGGYWHRDVPGGANYDISIVNLLVWGYKLTGDTDLLDRAKVHFRQATRWREGEPGANVNPTPYVGATEVYDFIDTRRNTGGSQYFIDNKGQLQYCYQVFENGGDPPTLGDPSWLGSQAVNAWAEVSGTTIGGGIPSVNPYSLDTIGLVGRWNGYAFDDVNLRYYGLANGGHNDYAGNQVLRCDLGSSPGWTEPVAATTVAAGSIAVNGSNTAQETYADGRPSSAHSYYCHQFVRKAGRAFLIGQGAIWNSGGVTDNVFAYAEGATDWDHAGSNYQVWSGLGGSQFESVRVVCKHPTTEDIFYSTNDDRLYRFRVAAPFTAGSETHTNLTGTPTDFSFWCAAVDSTRNRIVFWRGNGLFGSTSTTVHIYDIDGNSWSTGTITGAAAGTITGGDNYQAFVYSPATDKFYIVLRSMSGGTVYEMTSAFVVTALSTTGGSGMTADTNGPCNRLQYAALPSGKGGLFWHPNHTSNVWFLRLH